MFEIKLYFLENGRVGAQYERAAARPGTPLRLAGVFADGSKAKAPKYAQLIDPQGNVSTIYTASILSTLRHGERDLRPAVRCYELNPFPFKLKSKSKLLYLNKALNSLFESLCNTFKLYLF